MKPITFYTRSGCIMCDRSKLVLERGGVTEEYIMFVDLDANPQALEGLTEEGWAKSLPAIVCSNLDLRISGYRPEHLRTLVDAYGQAAA